MTKADCETGGGVFQDFGSTCVPNPCMPLSNCCNTIFRAFDGSCRFFLTKTTVFSATYDNSGSPFHRTGSADITTIETYNIDTCASSCSRSGDDQSVETDIRNSCVTLNGFVDTAQICGEWKTHRIRKDSHSGTDCTLISDSYFTFTDGSLCSPSITIPSTVCPQVNSGSPSCSNTATTATASDSTSGGSWSAVATLSDEVSCPPGACCDFDLSECTIQTECECGDMGFSYAGDNTVCPDDCGFSPPP
jgi:hypothetical protein